MRHINNFELLANLSSPIDKSMLLFLKYRTLRLKIDTEFVYIISFYLLIEFFYYLKRAMSEAPIER